MYTHKMDVDFSRTVSRVLNLCESKKNNKSRKKGERLGEEGSQICVQGKADD